MKNISQLRESDEKGEKAIAKFLDKNFYNVYCSEIHRTMDSMTNIKGTDIAFSLNGKSYKCDEKAAVTRTEGTLKTFCLEALFVDRGNNEHIGWFLDTSKENDSYLFVWIDKIEGKWQNKVEQIKEIEIALVRKQKLYDFFKNINVTGTEIVKCIKKIKDKKNAHGIYAGEMGKNNIHFSYSKYLAEKPINIIVPRKIYRDLSDLNLIIKPS